MDIEPQSVLTTRKITNMDMDMDMVLVDGVPVCVPDLMEADKPKIMNTICRSGMLFCNPSVCR